MDTLKKRRFDFIKDETFKLLSKTQRKKLDEYREQYRLCVLKEKKINTLKKQIKEQQDLLRLMKRDLTQLSKPLKSWKMIFSSLFQSRVTKIKGIDIIILSVE